MKRFLILFFALLPFLGLAQQQVVNVGGSANDHTGDPLRTAFQKVNANDAELYSNVLSSATASGTDTYTAAPDPPITSYLAGQKFIITFTNGNTGTSTINLNGLGAKTLKKNVSTNLISGDIAAGGAYLIMYDGTNFQVLTLMGGVGGSGTTNEIAYWTSATAIGALTTATYPSLTELAFVKGVTSAIQTQLNSKVAATRNINTTSPITGGGDLSADRTIAINNAVADGSTKGAASFTAADFDASSGNISIDYTNGQASSGSTKGFLTSADWTTFNGKQDVGLSYLLASGGTASGANTYTGTTTNTFKYVFNSLNTTQTNGAGHWLSNTTAAAAGAQQISPSTTWEGQGWKTNATAASQSVKFTAYTLPVQGAANPSGNLTFAASIDGGAYSTLFQLKSGGGHVSTGATFRNEATAGSSNYVELGPSSTSMITFANTSGTVSVGIQSGGANMIWANKRVQAWEHYISQSGATWDTSAPIVTRTGTTGTGTLVLSGNTINAGTLAVEFRAGVGNLTANTSYVAGMDSNVNFNPTTGNANIRFMSLRPTVNTTGSFSGGNVSGYNYDPTMTSSTGVGAHRAFWHTSGFVAWESVLSPAQITSNQNDYNPTGLNTGGAPHGASILRLSTDASRDITSITGGVSGRLLIIANVGAQNIVIKDDDGATGTAANRFQLSADFTLAPEQSAMFWYDATSSRWRKTY